MLKLIDLFSGCGGFARGAVDAGFEVSTAYDVDPILSSSYKANFPATKHILADISELSGNNIQDAADSSVDGIFGGPPCQGFSTIGRRLEDDPRRDLLFHFFRIVSEVRPKFFVMENVCGLVQGSMRNLLTKALQLVEQEYDVSGPFILNAAKFGAATNRPRVFVVGFEKKWSIHIEKEEIQIYERPAATVRHAIQDLEYLIPVGDQCDDIWRIGHRSALSEYASSLISEDRIITGNVRTSHTEAVVERFSSVLPGTRDRVGRHARLDWEGQCPTLRAGTGADRGSYQSVRPIHPSEHRVITVREAARLQGFPDAHVFHRTIWHSFRMIGNSVSPIVSRALFLLIRNKLERAECFGNECRSFKGD